MRKTPAPIPVSAPVTMPVIRLRVNDDGTMSATVDGEPLAPPQGEGAWRRGSFARIVDEVTAERMIPARVEVREVDGSTFTDIIPATARRKTPTQTPPEPEPESKPEPRLMEVAGEGFVGGEDIAVCVVIRHSDAAPDGTARALLDLTADPIDHDSEVILLGRVSGTVVVRGLS
ncbi:hypothetical protein ACP6NG_10930 [Brevibacterium casei]|uniref:hypothetical protein n=1 Tax=Brevibacterium casei TaxID=33889 RepID=UPI003F8143B6